MDYSKHTILIIDDDVLFKKFLKSIIVKNLNANVFEVNDPIEGFEYLKQNIPSLILLDMEMPNMDGFTALKMIRRIETTKDIPVIPCTALRTKDLVINLIQLNIADYIEKSTDANTIIKKIKKVLNSIDEKNQLANK